LNGLLVVTGRGWGIKHPTNYKFRIINKEAKSKYLPLICGMGYRFDIPYFVDQKCGGHQWLIIINKLALAPTPLIVPPTLMPPFISPSNWRLPSQK
jgi:hypothetical protein